MIPWLALTALAVSAGEGHALNAGALPVCSNRTIHAVVKRAGCTVGDARCWMRSGGFCVDYVQKRTRVGPSSNAMQMKSIEPEEVRKGDVAAFVARAHYAYVERVVRGADGKPVAVDVSEYNFGTCWVDREIMVTDQYKIVNKRSGIALRDVDGGFLRPVLSAGGSR